MTAGLNTCRKISRSDEEEEEEELLLFEVDAFEEDLDDAFEELELLDAPSGGSNANTMSWKWPRNSVSFRKASFHIVATSSGGFLNPGPNPKLPMQRL